MQTVGYFSFFHADNVEFSGNPDIRMPFGGRMLIEEFFMLFIQTVATIAYVLIHTATFTFHMSCSLMVEAFCNDIRTIFDRMNALASDAKEHDATTCVQKLTQELGKIADFHGNVIACVSIPFPFSHPLPCQPHTHIIFHFAHLKQKLPQTSLVKKLIAIMSYCLALEIIAAAVAIASSIFLVEMVSIFCSRFSADR